MNEESLFLAALDMTSPDDRQAFLDKECVDDPVLFQRVQKLLEVYESGGHKLEPASHLPEETSAQFKPSASDVPTQNLGPTIQTKFNPTGEDTVIAGRYKLIDPIGEGGMGSVWLAEQFKPIKRQVAVKLIRGGAATGELLARFEAERQALALMDHPNIAKVLDGGITHEGLPFFVMELVRGYPLTEFCDDNQLSIRERLNLFVQVCQAVQHAHQKGIIHRDLKPSNLLVITVDGVPTPKVIDFGIAKATKGKLTDETRATAFGVVMGTLEYMSPEQAGGDTEDIDTRTDIYALGVILYELLTGLRPFDSSRLKDSSFDKVIQIIREEDPPRPSSRLSGADESGRFADNRRTETRKLVSVLRGDPDWIVMKCLEKERDRRFESASALHQDVNRFLNNEPVEARPPSARYRVGKFVRKNRTVLVTVVAFAVLLISGSVVSVWQAVLANQARISAEKNEGTAKKLAAIAKKNAEEAKREKKVAEEKTKLAEEKTKLSLARQKQYRSLVRVLESVISPADPKFNMHKIVEVNPSFTYVERRDLRKLYGDRLAGATKQLKREEIDDPATVSESLIMFARALNGLGYYAKAIPLFEEALRIRSTLFGDEHLMTLETINGLGTAHLHQGDSEKAIKLFDSCLRILDTKSKQTTRNLRIQLLNNLGSAHMNVAHAIKNHPRSIERKTVALDYFKRALAEVEDPNVNTHANLTLLRNIAATYYSLGDYQRSENLLDRNYMRCLEFYGEDNPHTLSALSGLVQYYVGLELFDEALPKAEKLAQLSRQTLGEIHQHTQNYTAGLAAVYRFQGHPERAVSLMKRSCDVLRFTFGEQNRRTKSAKRLLEEFQRVADVFKKEATELTSLQTLAKGADGTLSAGDLPDIHRVRQFRTGYRVNLQANIPYMIDVQGDFDTCVRVETKYCLFQTENNNEGEPVKGRSRLVFIPPTTDEYRIVVMSGKKGETGKFRLVVQKAKKAGIPMLIVKELNKKSPQAQSRYLSPVPIAMKKGITYSMMLKSNSFPCHLSVFDLKARKKLAARSGRLSGNHHIARIDFTPVHSKKYYVNVTSVGKHQTGAFVLDIHRFEPPKAE